MKPFRILALLLLCFTRLYSQQALTVIDETGSPLPYAVITMPQGEKIFSNLSGNLNLSEEELNKDLLISYPGYYEKRVQLSSSNVFVQVRLAPRPNKELILQQAEISAQNLVQTSIERKPQNDPELRLEAFEHKSYNKLFIDRDVAGTAFRRGTKDPAAEAEGRRFLSENVSVQSFTRSLGARQLIEGMSTAGFDSPVYRILGMDLELPSLYKKDYQVFDTRYAGPLAENAMKNYTYRILDTIANTTRPAYVIHFKPKRPRAVAGVEGIFMLDTLSFAIQHSKLGTRGQIEMDAEHLYRYFENEDLWFPIQQKLVLRPGTGGRDISIFGGSIAVGRVQKTFSLLDIILAPGPLDDDLYLSSTTSNYDIQLGGDVYIPRYSPVKKAAGDAGEQPLEFWEINRREPFNQEDLLTEERLQTQIAGQNIERKIEIQDAIGRGFFPVGIWNFDLSRFINYNDYEGLRLGVGGETNARFSETFRLTGYGLYGFGDRRFKYGFGAGALLNKTTGTWFKLNFRDDIREIASYNYIRGVRDFSLFEPRLVNINYYYAHRDLEASLEHRITPKLDTELELTRSDISQLLDYSFIKNGEFYRSYTISEAKLGFLWRPFSQFISTPRTFDIYSQEYPVITGQVSRGFAGVMGGDFDFTKIGLRGQYKTTHLDKSSTHVILEGNLGFGELPLTHAFHAFPNNANLESIRDRFAVAGKLSFETMYFNEFFSDKQAAVHIRHHLRPIYITENYRPQVVLISRHVIGNFSNIEAHRGINFNTLEHGYSEAGLELNNLLLGFGLSTAYRYGAYHLPTFKENFSLKFTFQFQL